MSQKQLEILVNARDNASPAFKSAGNSAKQMLNDLGGDSLTGMLRGFLKIDVAAKALRAGFGAIKGAAQDSVGDMGGAVDSYIKATQALESMPVIGEVFKLAFDVTGIREGLEAQKRFLAEQAAAVKKHVEDMKGYTARIAELRMEMDLVGLDGPALERKRVINDVNKRLPGLGDKWDTANQEHGDRLRKIGADDLSASIWKPWKWGGQHNDNDGALRNESRRMWQEQMKKIADVAATETEAGRKKLAEIGKKQKEATDAFWKTLQAGGRSEERAKRVLGLTDSQEADEAAAMGKGIEAAKIRLKMAMRDQVEAIEKERESAIEKMRESAKKTGSKGWESVEAERQIREGARKEIEVIQEVNARKLKVLESAETKRVAKERELVSKAIGEAKEFEMKQRLKAAEEAGDTVLAKKLAEDVRVREVFNQFDAEIEKLDTAIAKPETSDKQREILRASVKELRALREERMREPKEKPGKERPDLNFQYSTRLTGLREADRETQRDAAAVQQQLKTSEGILDAIMGLQVIIRNTWDRLKVASFN